MNATFRTNGSVTAHWGVTEWTAFGTFMLIVVAAALRQESRMTRQETISENVVKVLDRLEDNYRVVKRVEASVNKIPERGESKADAE